MASKLPQQHPQLVILRTQKSDFFILVVAAAVLVDGDVLIFVDGDGVIVVVVVVAIVAVTIVAVTIVVFVLGSKSVNRQSKVRFFSIDIGLIISKSVKSVRQIILKHFTFLIKNSLALTKCSPFIFQFSKL